MSSSISYTSLILFNLLAVIGFTIPAMAESSTPSCYTKLSDKVLTASHRSKSHINRNSYRHPLETLEFFGLKRDMKVIEIWPGPNGWYTEILAPLLREHGTLYAAHFPQDSSIGFFQKSHFAFRNKLEEHPHIYDKVIITELNPPKHTQVIKPGSADMVLTFRNVHNWIKADKEALFFKAFYTALKPGGILGVVEHRGGEEMTRKRMAMSGYVPESFTIQLAKDAGFKLVAKSEINANPKDIKSYPEGVWTLPPTLRLKKRDQDKYLAIGESDRMTLKFIKPK